MKKVNLLKKIIIADKKELLQALNSQKYFGITVDGKITYTPDEEVVIFKTKHTPKLTPLTPSKPLDIAEVLGSNYKVVENEEQVGIKASLAWQEIIKLNYDLALYDDTTGDGIDEFSDNDLEALGWHADEFEIKYRELVEVLENKCEGLLLCIEQEEPSYRFSGLGFITDPKSAYEVLFEYVQKKIAQKMEQDPLYAKEKLTDDEQEAAKYFKLL
jgi:hypothetical protein